MRWIVCTRDREFWCSPEVFTVKATCSNETEATEVARNLAKASPGSRYDVLAQVSTTTSSGTAVSVTTERVKD